MRKAPFFMLHYLTDESGYDMSRDSLTDDDIETILRDLDEELQQLMDAVLAGDQDVDLDLAALVEGAPQQVRIAIVEKLRAMVKEQNEEKARELDVLLEQEKERAKEQEKGLMQRWLAHMLSQETLRKLRESFLARPDMARQVEDIGQDLAKKGVLQNMDITSRNDLGELSATVNKGKEKGGGRER